MVFAVGIRCAPDIANSRGKLSQFVGDDPERISSTENPPPQSGRFLQPLSVAEARGSLSARVAKRAE